MDLHEDAEKNLVTASFEFPGLKKEDVQIELHNGRLTVADFGCFQTKFVAGDMYADCDSSGALAVQDFGCFQTKFVAGCP